MNLPISLALVDYDIVCLASILAVIFVCGAIWMRNTIAKSHIGKGPDINTFD